MRRLTAAVVFMAILVGIAATVAVLRERGGAGLLRIEQSRALALKPSTVVAAAQVEAVVAQAPEPVPVARRTDPAHVHCRAGAGGVLRDPWSCTIRYRSGTLAYYRVEVQPDGHYSGRGTGRIEGCCVKVPTLD
ncbi:MAG: hypothetical protein WBV85_11875 [Solirubrobacteraceae bacterium]